MKKTTGRVVAISTAIIVGSMIPISVIANHGCPAPRIANCTNGWTVTIRLYTERDTNHSVAYKKFNRKGGNKGSNNNKGESKDAAFRDAIGPFPDWESRNDKSLKAAARIADKKHPCPTNVQCKTYKQVTYVKQFFVTAPVTLKRGMHYGVYPVGFDKGGKQKDGAWHAKQLGFTIGPLGNDGECEDW